MATGTNGIATGSDIYSGKGSIASFYDIGSRCPTKSEISTVSANLLKCKNSYDDSQCVRYTDIITNDGSDGIKAKKTKIYISQGNISLQITLTNLGFWIGNNHVTEHKERNATKKDWGTAIDYTFNKKNGTNGAVDIAGSMSDANSEFYTCWGDLNRKLNLVFTTGNYERRYYIKWGSNTYDDKFYYLGKIPGSTSVIIRPENYYWPQIIKGFSGYDIYIRIADTTLSTISIGNSSYSVVNNSNSNKKFYVYNNTDKKEVTP